MGWIRRVEFHIEGEVIVGTLGKGQRGVFDDIIVRMYLTKHVKKKKKNQRGDASPLTWRRISLARSIQVWWIKCETECCIRE